MAFVDMLHRWQSFFGLEGEATASFAGLLFVALSINGQRLLKPENRHLQLLAKQTFSNLLLITSMSFLALAPILGPKTLGYPLIVGAMFGLLTALGAMRAEKNARAGARITREYARAYYGPAALYAGLMAAGFGIAQSQADALASFAFLSVALLVASARNAWLLLVSG